MLSFRQDGNSLIPVGTKDELRQLKNYVRGVVGLVGQIRQDGGPGSGNFGHAGRPGERGGSSPAGGGGAEGGKGEKSPGAKASTPTAAGAKITVANPKEFDAYFDSKYADRMEADFAKNPESIKVMNSIVGGGSDYKAITSGLIGGKLTASQQRQVNGIDKYLDKYATEEAIVAFRGTNSRELANATVGSEVTMPSYAAFSGQEAWAKSFVGRAVQAKGEYPVLIKTTIPPKTAAPTVNIKLSENRKGEVDFRPTPNSSEVEFLVKRGQSFKVTKTAIKTAKINGKSITYKEVTVEFTGGKK